jgi:crotonobetainyl-CoA:carnitine CoA-transferase CaiB-like acyl-CoA transferase
MLWQLALEGVPAEPVQINQQDAFFAARGSADSDLVARYPHPTWGIVEQIGSLWNMGDLPPRLDRASPTLGQHSREICEEIGLDPKIYEALKAKELLVGD